MATPRILVTLSQDQHAYVQAEAKREGRTLSGMVRQMVQERMPLLHSGDVVIKRFDGSGTIDTGAYRLSSMTINGQPVDVTGSTGPCPITLGKWQRASDELEPHDAPKKGKI